MNSIFVGKGGCSLRENAESVVPSGASADAVHRAALGAWAQVHGLAVLLLDGQIPRDDALIDALIGEPDTMI